MVNTKKDGIQKGKAKTRGRKPSAPKPSASPVRSSQATDSMYDQSADEHASPCRLCSKMVGDDAALQCDLCNAWVHLECSGVGEGEYASLKEIHNPNVKWFCHPCLKKLGENYDDRQAQNEAKIDTLMSIVVTLQQQNELILKMIEKNNIMIEKKSERRGK